MKFVRRLKKCTILKAEPLSAIFELVVSESSETSHRCITTRMMLSARKSRVTASSHLELEHFEGQCRVTYI